jgi:GTPase SAR1 family protein
VIKLINLNLDRFPSVILHVVSLAEYDLLCYEDNNTNRSLESLDCFECVLKQNKSNTSFKIYLLFNQLDSFKQKYFTSDLSKVFKDFSYQKYPTPEDGMQYFADKYTLVFQKYYSNKVKNILYKCIGL